MSNDERFPQLMHEWWLTVQHGHIPQDTRPIICADHVSLDEDRQVQHLRIRAAANWARAMSLSNFARVRRWQKRASSSNTRQESSTPQTMPTNECIMMETLSRAFLLATWHYDFLVPPIMNLLPREKHAFRVHSLSSVLTYHFKRKIYGLTVVPRPRALQIF